MFEKKEEVNYLANVVVVRNHLATLLEGNRKLVARGDVNILSAIISKLDSMVLTQGLSLFENKVPVEDEIDFAAMIKEAKAQLEQKAAMVEVSIEEAPAKEKTKKGIARRAK